MMSQDHPKKEKEDEVKLAEEAEWVQRASEGDQDALIKLYESYIDHVYRYCFTRVRSVSEAEALTSETFTRAVDALAQGRYDYWQGKSFRAWLVGIAKRVLQEHYRALKSTPVIEDLNDTLENDESTRGEDDPLDWIVQQEERNALWQLVRALPDAEQNILIMRHAQKLSYAEIAKRLRLSESDCKRLHYRVLKKLKLLTQETDLWSKIARGENEHKNSLPAEVLLDEQNTRHSIKEDKEHSFHDEEQEDTVLATLTTYLTIPYVEKALEELPWLERSCLLLHADAQFSEADIAEILNLDEEAVCRYLQTGSQHWLHAYSSFLEKELDIPLNAVPVSHNEDFSRVKRLIGCSPRWEVGTQHVDGNIGSTVN